MQRARPYPTGPSARVLLLVGFLACLLHLGLAASLLRLCFLSGRVALRLGLVLQLFSHPGYPDKPAADVSLVTVCAGVGEAGADAVPESGPDLKRCQAHTAAPTTAPISNTHSNSWASIQAS